LLTLRFLKTKTLQASDYSWLAGFLRSGEEIRTPKKARKGACLLDFFLKNLSQTLARISSPPNEIK
jgi:hypothetical protein